MNLKEISHSLPADPISQLTQDIIMAVVKLADNADNIAELHKLTAALDGLIRGSDAYQLMKKPLDTLNEYVDLQYEKNRGENINEEHLIQLREDLLDARA